MRSYAARVPSPLGPLTLLFDGEALTGLGLLRWRYPPACLAEAAPGDSLPVLAQTRRWLDAYFARQTLPPEPPVRTAGTPFQELAWAELRRIPRGTVTTYGAIAGAVGRLTGIRPSAQAVGGAVGHNPVSILIPCHRVVGADGSLTGYGGGLDAKLALLTLEGADTAKLYRPVRGTAL